jgi:hypothetical protein
MMSGVGFEPTSANTGDLKSLPLDLLGHPDVMLEAGFEPARLAPDDLKSSSLDHSDIPARVYTPPTVLSIVIKSLSTLGVVQMQSFPRVPYVA